MTAPRPRTIVMAEGFEAVAVSLMNESDRGTVVLAVAWLDESLTRIITKFLKPTSNSKENLLNPGQPIGDFGTKILLADRLQLIAPNLTQSLSLCRKLRNDFAHISSELTFDTQHVKDRVHELFRLNEDLLVTMGEVLTKSGMKIGADDKESDVVTAKQMLETFGSKILFQHICGFINSALATIEYDIKQHPPLFSFDGNIATL